RRPRCPRQSRPVGLEPRSVCAQESRAADFYIQAGRLATGSVAAMMNVALSSWEEDNAHGKQSLLVLLTITPVRCPGRADRSPLAPDAPRHASRDALHLTPWQSYWQSARGGDEPTSDIPQLGNAVPMRPLFRSAGADCSG